MHNSGLANRSLTPESKKDVKREGGGGMLFVGLLFGVVICFGVPIGGVVMLGRRKKGMGKAFLPGALAFVISQLLIRIPLLKFVLPQYAWYGVLQLNPWTYGLFLGLTAGLFEETARWIAICFFLKGKQEREHGLAFGLGHGGIEAIVLVGVPLLGAALQLFTDKAALPFVGAGSLFIIGIERLFAITFHVGASLLVMYGVRRRKPLFLLAAIFLHTLLDAAVVILPAVWGTAIAGIEVCAAFMAAITLFAGIRCYQATNCHCAPRIF